MSSPLNPLTPENDPKFAAFMDSMKVTEQEFRESHDKAVEMAEIQCQDGEEQRMMYLNVFARTEGESEDGLYVFAIMPPPREKMHDCFMGLGIKFHESQPTACPRITHLTSGGWALKLEPGETAPADFSKDPRAREIVTVISGAAVFDGTEHKAMTIGTEFVMRREGEKLFVDSKNQTDNVRSILLEKFLMGYVIGNARSMQRVKQKEDPSTN